MIDTEEITEDLAKTGEFFGLKIKGDSMEPRIYDGDVVIVRQQNDAESGDIVIALVSQITTISKVRIYNPITKHCTLHGIRLSNENMDELDNKIKELYTKQ